MPEIFIPDAPDPEPDAEALAERQAAEMAATATWAEWLAAQSPTVQALAEEWGTLRGSRFTFSERRDKHGRRVYVCQCEHGYHESLQSHEHAVFLLVDSHRTRAEDLPDTRAQLEAAGLTPKEALRRCQGIGLQIVKSAGRLPIAEHDALVAAAVADAETQIQAEQAAKAALQAEREALAAVQRAERDAARAAAEAAAQAAADAEAAERASTLATIADLVARLAAVESKT